MSEKKKSGQVGVKISDHIHQGAYSNQLVVAHSREEFVLDFLVTFPPGAQVVARVITSPGHLKRISEALEDNIRQYEAKYGPLSPASSEPPPIDPGRLN